MKVFLLLLALLAVAQSTYHPGNYARWPRFPEEFRFSYRGTIHGYHCVKIIEPSDPVWKNGDNFFCSKAGNGIRNPGMVWSYAGPKHGMRCFRVYEPSEPKHYNWHDNWLCVPHNSPYHLRFFNHNVKYSKCRCVQWIEPSDPHTWKDNFMCNKD
eukprot:TCONS_00017917-protein